jgi:hypothetical protein
MDLDELKHQLKNKLASDHAGRSDGDLASLLNRRTGSIIDKLKRNIRTEILFSILFIVLFCYIGVFGWNQPLRIYFSVFAVICAPFVVVLFYLLRRTTRLTDTVLPVKKNLQEIVKLTEEFIKRYFLYTMASLPVCFIFALLLVYNESDTILQVEKTATGFFTGKGGGIVLLTVYFLALSTVAYYFTKWYLRKMYGKYINQLKECIRELSEEE